jgi:Ribbon-helix-helix protein, copG family
MGPKANLVNGAAQETLRADPNTRRISPWRGKRGRPPAPTCHQSTAWSLAFLSFRKFRRLGPLQMINWIPPSELGIPEERVCVFKYGGRPLYIRFTLEDAERLEARARKHGISATELMRRMIKQHLDGDDPRPSDM